jgi:hypothetical protein
VVKGHQQFNLHSLRGSGIGCSTPEFAPLASVRLLPADEHDEMSQTRTGSACRNRTAAGTPCRVMVMVSPFATRSSSSVLTGICLRARREIVDCHVRL